MSRKTLTLVVLLVAVSAVGLAACGGGDDEGSGDGEAVTVALDTQNDSGQSGTATLEPAGDGQTTVTLELSNPPDNPQPVHIHSGSCAELGEVVYPLTNLEGGASTTTVDVTIEALQAEPFAINAHESEENIQLYVACGDIAS